MVGRAVVTREIWVRVLDGLPMRISAVVARLALNQETEVRILDPQPTGRWCKGSMSGRDPLDAGSNPVPLTKDALTWACVAVSKTVGL